MISIFLILLNKIEIILVLFQTNQTNQMNHALIKQKYGGCSSWAIWKRRDTTQKKNLEWKTCHSLLTWIHYHLIQIIFL